jgi:hypothetical protein
MSEWNGVLTVSENQIRHFLSPDIRSPIIALWQYIASFYLTTLGSHLLSAHYVHSPLNRPPTFAAKERQEVASDSC